MNDPARDPKSDTTNLRPGGDEIVGGDAAVKDTFADGTGTEDSAAKIREKDMEQSSQQPASVSDPSFLKQDDGEDAAGADARGAGLFSDSGAKSERRGDASTQPDVKEVQPSLADKVKRLTKHVNGNIVPTARSLHDNLRQLQREKDQWVQERRGLEAHIESLESAVTNAYSELNMINALLMEEHQELKQSQAA